MTDQVGPFLQIVRHTLEPMLVQAQLELEFIEDDSVIIYSRNPEKSGNIYRIILNSVENSPELDMELGEFHWIRVYILSKKRYPLLLGALGERQPFLLPSDPHLRESWLYATQEQLADSIDEIAELLRDMLLHDGKMSFSHCSIATQ